MPLQESSTMATIPLGEWLKAKDNYHILRMALCDIEGGIPDDVTEAKRIAARAIAVTPPSL